VLDGCARGHVEGRQRCPGAHTTGVNRVRKFRRHQFGARRMKINPKMTDNVSRQFVRFTKRKHLKILPVACAGATKWNKNLSWCWQTRATPCIICRAARSIQVSGQSWPVWLQFVRSFIRVWPVWEVWPAFAYSLRTVLRRVRAAALQCTCTEVTGVENIGQCGWLSQLSWLLGAL